MKWEDMGEKKTNGKRKGKWTRRKETKKKGAR